jgi:hypothetical protein
MRRLILTALLAWPCFGAITLYNSYSAVGTGTTATITLPFTPSVNDLMVLSFVADSTSGGTPSGWTLAVTQNQTAYSYVYLYYKIAGASESSHITVSVPSGGPWSLGYAEFTSIAASPLDTTASAQNQGGSGSIASGTTSGTSQANEVWVCVAGVVQAYYGVPVYVSSWSGGFTSATGDIFYEYGNPGDTGLNMAYKIVSSTGSASSTATLSSNATHSTGVIATFKGAAFVRKRVTVVRN